MKPLPKESEMANLEAIQHYYRVDESLVSKAHRIEDLTKHIVFYQVESRSLEGVEYKVYFDQVHKVLTCTCPAGESGSGCWHKRAALAHSEEIRQEKISRQEAAMIELAAEMAEEARAHSPYTVQVDETSSSLDGCEFEIVNGRPCPMK
jgi:hypothetical protein